jgi:hexokinase
MDPLTPTTLFPLITAALQQASPTSPTPTSPKFPVQSLEAFAHEAETLFTRALSAPESLFELSAKLQAEAVQKLWESDSCMLPSFNHTLPTGDETGEYLALDVGGSNLRVAFVKLYGKKQKPEILRMTAYSIGEEQRSLEGRAFFDWVAGRIEECLTSSGKTKSEVKAGVAWSFPVEQTSVRSGAMLEMGKGFRADKGVVGVDVAELIVQACQKRVCLSSLVRN